MQTLKDGPQLCFLRQTVHTRALFRFVSHTTFLQHGCFLLAAAAGFSLWGRNVLGRASSACGGPGVLRVTASPEVPSCRAEKAPPSGRELAERAPSG